MRRVLSYALTLLNFALFLLVFIVTRDLYQTLFVFFYRLATAREMSAFRVSALLRTFDMVGLFGLGLVVIVLIIVIQAAYERARSSAQLGARFALVIGLQLMWIGATRVIVWIIPAGVRNLSLDAYTLLPLAAGGAALVAGIMLRRRLSAS
jgi:hypothetical protein